MFVEIPRPVITAIREGLILTSTFCLGFFVTLVADTKLRELLNPPDDVVIIICPTCATRNRVDDGDTFSCWKCEIDRRTAESDRGEGAPHYKLGDREPAPDVSGE